MNQINTQKERNLAHIKNIKQMLKDDKTRQIETFKKLRPGEKRFLLLASGIDFVGSVENHQLTTADLRLIHNGLNRLQTLINKFK